MAEALTATLNAMHKSGCILLQDVVEGNLSVPAFNIHFVMC